MAIYAREPESKFTTAPEGLHSAACCDVVDLGLVTDQFGTRPMIDLRWMLERLDTQDADERRVIVRKRYRNTLHEKSSLRRDLEMWRGRKFTADELKGFDLEKLLGVSCQIQIVHNVKDNGKIYANVAAVIPLGKGMPKVGVDRDYVREIDRHPDTAVGDTSDMTHDDSVPF